MINDRTKKQRTDSELHNVQLIGNSWKGASLGQRGERIIVPQAGARGLHGSYAKVSCELTVQLKCT